jgi:hypothetical protein
MDNEARNPCYVAVEAQLATLPNVGIPAILIHRIANAVNPPQIPEVTSAILPACINSVSLRVSVTIRRSTAE